MNILGLPQFGFILNDVEDFNMHIGVLDCVDNIDEVYFAVRLIV